MASASKKKKSSKNKGINLQDERIPKLLGALSLFFALYLFIAFTSYLFTWQIDQDRVLRFSWSLLAQGDIEMANWLGRLGAIVSNMFFYWGFGLPSYLFVAALALTGVLLIQKTPLLSRLSFYRNSFLVLLIASVFLEFVTRGAEFPWGGAFGNAVSIWLENFVGTLGLIFLFLFLFIGVIIWNFNPNFNDVTPQGVWEELKIWASEIMAPKKRVTVPNVPDEEIERPSKPQEEPNTLRPRKELDLELEQPEIKHDKGNQLSFELDESNNAAFKKEKPLEAGNSDLEIDETPEEGQMGDSPLPTSAPDIQAQNADHSEPYDPTLELSSYEYPHLQLLESYDELKGDTIDRSELEANKDQIIATLLNYKIEITKIRATIGPTVTLYEIIPAAGVRISRIKNLEDDIALNLAALGIRIIAPIPGRGTIGIEVPNKKSQIVPLRDMLEDEKFRRAKMDLPIALGKTIANEVFIADLAKMPHLLIAGATGQGKSVGINAVLVSLLYKKHPSQVKLVLIDPKKVELFPYSSLENHFLTFLPGADEPITTETNKVVYTLNALTIEMEQRYDLLKQAQARNIKEYNQKFVARKLNPNNGHKFLPFIVLVIDEFADLIMTAGKEIELPIGRLAQLSRAVGIHLIIATQRPSVNIITGVIKANFPARIAFKVSSKVDSRTILDTGGADQLVGRGDMLLSVGGNLIRLQCPFVDTPEVEKVIQFISEQRGFPEPMLLPEYSGDDDEMSTKSFALSELDDMFEDAARLVVQNQHGSTSMIQRRLKLGYNRAGRIMDQMEALGIVGPSEGSKPREVLIYDEMELERYLEDIRNRK
ncbi:MAG: DNA translocase FtsK 4TM domain-containing protein [Saprospiraceae bacterium]|nr:DNA translocase FtsK 4TM domain-containing protein [Saprospiraceae bacterium]